MIDGPGGPVDFQEDHPKLCRVSHDMVKKRMTCAICSTKVHFGVLVLITKRKGATYVRHASCVSRARAATRPKPVLPAKPDHGLRVVATGGRSFDNYLGVEKALSQIPVVVLAHGGAPGADLLAGRWARRHQVTVEVYEAEWGRYGPRAGPIRNRAMLDDFAPDLVVAFKGATGTADCMSAATERKIPVWDTTKDRSALKVLGRALSNTTGQSG